MDAISSTSAVRGSSSVLRNEALEFMPQIQVEDDLREEGTSAEFLEKVTEPSSAPSPGAGKGNPHPRSLDHEQEDSAPEPSELKEQCFK